MLPGGRSVVTSQGGGNDAPNLSAEVLFGALFEQSAMGRERSGGS